MARYSPSVQNLIAQLGGLPGIGGKSAQRLAFHILSMKDDEANALSNAIVNARATTRRCSSCHNFTDTDPCPICSDPTRDHTTICVVETPRDVAAFERTQEYRGLYHVLHGVFSPMQGKSMNDITLAKLIERLQNDKNIKEVIVATNQTADGNATAMYIARLLSPAGIKVTRLASGLPMGSDIEYTDDLTLLSALKGRTTIS